jgi:hypothetical protein
LSQPAKSARRRTRLLWFIALWLGGVTTTALVGLLIKLMVRN